MKAKDVLCKRCSSPASIHGADHNNCEGPWQVVCDGCGEETDSWAYQREAWKQWKFINKKNIFIVAREKRGLSREQVAHEIDVTYHAVATWEYGHGYPRPSNLRAVKDVLGLTPNEIFNIS